MGSGTLLSSLADTYLAMEEALILSGVIGSRFNLIAATHAAARHEAFARVPTGWSIPASSDALHLTAAGSTASNR